MERATLIENRLREILVPQKIEVRDDSHQHTGHEGAKSGGGHFTVTIVSHRFQGKNLVQRHQMIYQALNEMMKKEVHALSIQALAPDEL